MSILGYNVILDVYKSVFKTALFFLKFKAQQRPFLHYTRDRICQRNISDLFPRAHNHHSDCFIGSFYFKPKRKNPWHLVYSKPSGDPRDSQLNGKLSALMDGLMVTLGASLGGAVQMVSCLNSNIKSKKFCMNYNFILPHPTLLSK